MALRKNLADSMAAIRTERKKSLSEFAEELSISRSSLQDILKGKSNPTLSTVELIAKQLEVDPLLLLSCSKSEMHATVYLAHLLDWFQQLSIEQQQEFAAAVDTLFAILIGHKKEGKL